MRSTSSSTSAELDAHGRGEEWATSHPDYPRRQFQRANWVCLNGPWAFSYDDEGVASHPRDIGSWDRTIEVPFAPESLRSGVEDQGFHANAWYQRPFELHRKPDSRVLLHFGAVDYSARVWLNGQFLGSHEGGHTPFSFDITEWIAEDGANVVEVWAHDDPHELAKPRGKQDWQLDAHSIWYPRTTGIWQTVWLEEVPTVYLDRVRWEPLLERWEIGCEAFILGPVTEDLELRVRLSVHGRVLADDRYSVIESEVHRRIALSDPGIDDYRNELLWSPEHPTLIDADIQLLSGGTVIDEVRSYTALRAVACTRGRMLLNKRPYYLRLVLDQGYWPETLMTPPSEEAIIRDITLIKEAGFNGVRKHQKIEDPRFLYWADRLGLLVWEEMPSAYRFTADTIRRSTREWMEVIDRDINHPSIIVWVPFNESWGVPDLPDNESHRSAVKALYHLTRTLDPSRPVIGNDGWESSATDILGIHDYHDDPEFILRRYGGGSGPRVDDWPGGRVITLEDHPHEGQPVMLTEFGGIAHRDDRPSGATAIWGYSVSESHDDLRNRFELLLDAVNRVDAFSGYCYTQFTDTFQEANGLFYEDRTPKFDLEAMRTAAMGLPRSPKEVHVTATPRP